MEAVRGGLGGRGAPERPRGPGAGSARGSAPINSLEATVFFFLPQSLCSLRRWLWVWDRRQWPPRPFGRHFSPHLCVLFEICPRLTTSACLVSFALSGSSLAVGCLCALRRLPLVVFCVTGHLTGLVRTSVATVVAFLRAYRGQFSVVGGRRGAPESVVCLVRAVAKPLLCPSLCSSVPYVWR